MTEARDAAAQLQTLRAQLDGDWAAARQSAAEALRIRGRARRLARERLYGAALMVHHFYTAVEAILERVATGLDRTPPTGAAWHKDLLDRAALEIRGVRPAIITPELRPDNPCVEPTVTANGLQRHFQRDEVADFVRRGRLHDRPRGCDTAGELAQLLGDEVTSRVTSLAIR